MLPDTTDGLFQHMTESLTCAAGIHALEIQPLGAAKQQAQERANLHWSGVVAYCYPSLFGLLASKSSSTLR